jgi:radical SAM superfamily enzyme YgiQ (UPF0313 family)
LKEPNLEKSMEHEKSGNIVLIDLGTILYPFSIRTLSAYLKEKGHRVRVLHCPSGLLLSKEDPIFGLCSEYQIKLLVEFCQDADVIGISILTTHYLKRAIQITKELKRNVKGTIVWGGVPIICDPDFYLQYIEFVCLGEGEEFLNQFTQRIITGKPVYDLNNLGFRLENTSEIVKNPVDDLLDVNTLPIPFSDFKNTYVLKDTLFSLAERPDIVVKNSQKGYRIFSTRGCPFSCTFCSNNKLKSVFGARGKIVRSVNVESVIKELEEAKRIIPGLKSVMFCEDDFLVRNDEEFEFLIQEYIKHIGLPLDFSSRIENITEKKINILMKNKIKVHFIKIGLQSGSSNINKNIFKRGLKKEEFISKLVYLNRLNIPVVLDIISDNPFETITDKRENIRFFYALLKEYSVKKTALRLSLMDHKLMFYPGTELYSKALKEGMINGNYIKDVLLKRRTTRIQPTDYDQDKLTNIFLRMAKKNFMRPLSIFLLRIYSLPGIYEILKKFKIEYSFYFLKRIISIFMK